MTLRNPSNDHLLLIGLVALIFLLAALGLFLLQQPPAPLPWAKTATSSPLPTTSQPLVVIEHQPTLTPRTSYTPFISRLTALVTTPTLGPTSSPTASPTSGTPSTPTPTNTLAPTPLPGTTQPATPTATHTPTFLPGTPSPTTPNTPVPTPTPTLAPGETGISGRLVQNGTPVAGVTVSFRDDQPARTVVTDALGRYWFTTQAIGVDFAITFEQAANSQFSTSIQVASTALMYGYLPTGSTVISLPDLEISLVLDGQTFEALTPVDGAAFNATNITDANPIQFTWSSYNQVEYYYVELYDPETDQILWGSEDLTSTNVMFDGTLDDSTQIVSGSYYWMVIANRPVGDYRLTVYSQPRDLLINP